MAKKIESTKAKPRATAKKPAKGAVKAAPKVKAAPVVTGPRHPRAKLLAAHGSKEALARSIAPALAHGGEDADSIAARLRTASNRQLLRLAAAADKVKQKWGTREKLIEAIGAANKKSKDKDFLAKLETTSLPRLLDLAPRA